MLVTQILTCPLCGLHYTNGMLLDLHIREDHVQRDQPAPEAPPAGPPGPASAPAVTVPAAKTTAPRSRGRLSQVAMASLAWPVRAGRRAVRGLRYADDELLRASEAMLRPARFPQPGPGPEAPGKKTGR